MDTFFKNQWVIALNALLGLVVGLFGSLYSKEIQNAFPIYWGAEGWGDFSLRALIFWVSGAVFFLSFAWSTRAKSKELQTQIDVLSSQGGRIESLVRTLPPDGFLTQFQDLFRLGHELVIKSRDPNAQKKDVENAIVANLNAVAQLAWYFDDRPDTAYSANIMLFKAITALTDEEKREVRPKIYFLERDSDINALRGILVLMKGLAVTRATPPDKVSVPRIILPVPQQLKTNDLYNALPGAPQAFLERSPNGYYGYANARTLVDWCKESGNFKPEVHEAIKAYFGANGIGGSIRSFYSLALVESSSAPGISGKTIGVLNIHSEREDLLGGIGRAPLFFPLIEPFRSTLFDLCEALLDKFMTLDSKELLLFIREAETPPLQ